MNKKEMILVTGARGQIGVELVPALREKYGKENVIGTDLLPATSALTASGPYQQLDVLDAGALGELVNIKGITQIYHLAAMLSATGEQFPKQAWDVNMKGLLNILEVARMEAVGRVFWPSSIAVFGPDSPREVCPQHAVTEPVTVYGISKCAGEYWCRYYFEKHGLDVRSLRYPGLISHSALPGGGTTDYAVDVFYKALEKGAYTCFLSKNTRLPMLYMPDAIRATLELMEAPAEKLTTRTSYNLSAFSFTPGELAQEIGKHLPGFHMGYLPDFRQQIANGWPASIDDHVARRDWDWQPEYDLSTMTIDMLQHLKRKVLKADLAG